MEANTTTAPTESAEVASRAICTQPTSYFDVELPGGEEVQTTEDITSEPEDTTITPEEDEVNTEEPNFREELAALEQRLAEKERNCLLLEQQLVQANQQVESCYYQLEENQERICNYGTEVSSLREELEATKESLNNARMENDRAELVESERRKLSEMVADLSKQLEEKATKLEERTQKLDETVTRMKELETSLSEATSELSKLQKVVDSVERECEAHKSKASDIYALYQQLQEENMGLVKQVKDRTDSASVVSEGPSPKYLELSDEVEKLTRRCKEMDVVLSNKDTEISELQQRIQCLEKQSKPGADAKKPPVMNVVDRAADPELKRLENEIKMLKLNNAGLVRESAALKHQIAEKNSSIENLNCELLSVRQGNSSQSKNNLDLESYLSCRRGGMNANEASRKIHEVRSFKEVFEIAAEDRRYRMYCLIYLFIVHIFLLIGFIR